MDAEIEFLEQLVKTCRSVRNPNRPRARTELAVPAAQWEMRFQARIAELASPATKTQPKPELEAQAA